MSGNFVSFYNSPDKLLSFAYLFSSIDFSLQVYSNCSCITNDDIGTAKDGVCHGDEHCYQMFIFLPFLLITLFATFLARTPLLAVVLRYVKIS